MQAFLALLLEVSEAHSFAILDVISVQRARAQAGAHACMSRGGGERGSAGGVAGRGAPVALAVGAAVPKNIAKKRTTSYVFYRFLPF